jgi:hypothetical protein
MRFDPKYLRDGREISAAEALDARGVVRDGVITRVQMVGLDGFAADKLRHKSTVEYNKAGEVSHTFETTQDDPDDETERTESDAAPVFDAAAHRPGFFRGVRDEAALKRLDAIYTTLDYLDSQRWRGGGGEVVDAAPRNSQTTADAYEEYDRIAANAWRAGK